MSAYAGDVFRVAPAANSHFPPLLSRNTNGPDIEPAFRRRSAASSDRSFVHRAAFSAVEGPQCGKAAVRYVAVHRFAVAKVVPVKKKLLVSGKVGPEHIMGGHVASQTAAAIAFPQVTVSAVPPRSPVRNAGSVRTDSIAVIMPCAASGCPRCSNIIAPDQI